MNKSDVLQFVKSEGADVCGIAPIERFQNCPEGYHPNDILEKTASVIVFGKKLPSSVFTAKTLSPYTLCRNATVLLLDKISVSLSYRIEQSGYAAVPIPAVEPYEYWDDKIPEGKGIISLRHAGELAGIGKIGKNNLLINSTYGNSLWIGAVITSLNLEGDELSKDLCPEKCRTCLDACPQNALNGKTVDQMKCREVMSTYSFGGGWVFKCNRCLTACKYSNVIRK